MRRIRRISLFVVVAPVILMAAVCTAFLVSQVHIASKSIEKAVISAASEHLKTKVTIGNLRVSLTGYVFLEDVKILDPENGLPILSASRINIKSKFVDVALRRQDPMKGIQSVDIFSPRFYLRRGKDGRWNFVGILKPSTKPIAPFTGILRVKSGYLTIHDQGCDRDVAQINKFRSVNAEVDLSSHPIATYAASAIGVGERVGLVSLNGVYNLDNQTFNANVEAENLNAKYWVSYANRLKFMKVLSGSVHARLNLSRKEGKHFDYQCLLDIKEGEISFPKIKSPVKEVNGKVFIKDGLIDIDAKSKIGSTPFTVFGSVIGFKHPRLALDFRSGQANLREISHSLRSSDMFARLDIPSKGTCHLVAIGPARNPEISFEVKAPYLGYKQFRATEFRSIGAYKSKYIKIARAEGCAYGGKLFAEGTIWTSSEPSVSLVGKAVGVKLAQIPSLRSHGLTASTSGCFRANWSSKDICIDYQGFFGLGNFRGFCFKDGAGSITYQNGQFKIDEVSAHVMDGIVSASGNIAKNGALNLDVSAADVNLAKLAEKYWKKPTAGRMYVTGRLTGTVENPIYEGKVVAQPVVVSDIDIERIEAQVTAGRDLMNFHDLVIHRYPGEITIAGTVFQPFGNARTLNLTAKADSLDIQQIVGSSSLSNSVHGLLSADISITSLGTAPAFSGDVWIENGRIYNQVIDLAHAKVRYAGGTFAFQEVVLRSGDALLKADVNYQRDGSIKASFSGQNFQLGNIMKLSEKYPNASGFLSFQGTASGTIEQPQVDLFLNGHDVKVSGESFKQFTGNVRLSEGQLLKSNFVVIDGDSSIKFPTLVYQHNKGLLHLEADIESLPFSKILSLTRRILAGYDTQNKVYRLISQIPNNVQGFVTATMRGDVRLAEGIKPELQCECAFSNNQGEAGQIRTASIRGSWVGDVICVDKFEVASDEAVISGRGCVGPDDALDLNLDAHGLNLTTLCRWAKLQHNISGTADVTIIATGTVSQPVGQASVNVINPIIENTKFDKLRLRLSAGEPTLPTQQINIDELTLVLGQKEITASGFVPVNWQPLSISENGNLSLRLAFDNASLDLLAGITRTVVKNGTGGMLTGSMLINIPVGGGKLKTPRMQGDLTWTGGTIQFSRLDTTFQNIDMHCVFNGDVLTIEKCTGTSAKGGAFEVGGNVKFAELGPSLDLLVCTNSLGLSEKNLSNAYGENIRCKLDSKLKLTGNWRKPIIVGDVAVKDGTVDLTGKAEKIKGKRNQSVDPTFSVAVNVAKTFELRSSRIKTPIGGNLNIAGSLSKPLVEGQADLTGGTIIFPIHVFKILPGSNMKLRVHPDEPASVILDLRAKARLTALTGLGRRKRYTVIMEANGPWNALQPRFTVSPPELSEQMVIAMVTGQHSLGQIFRADQRGNMGKQLSELFSTAMMPTVLGSLGDVVSEALGVEEFTLEMGYKEPLQLSISEQLMDGLYLNYSSTLGARPDYADSRYQFKLSYRLPRSLELGLSTNERRETEITLEGKLKF